jgi:hypothetical protein
MMHCEDWAGTKEADQCEILATDSISLPKGGEGVRGKSRDLGTTPPRGLKLN